jgi:hypothetical protein
MTSVPTVINSLDPGLANRWPTAMTRSDVDALLVRAIYAGKVASCASAVLDLHDEYLDNEGRAQAVAAADACRSIDAETAEAQRRIIAALESAGIAAQAKHPNPAGNQFHSFELRISTDSLEAALSVADSESFRRWAPTGGGGWESYRRTHTAVTLIRADDVTTRWILRWADARRVRRLQRLMQPTVIDYRTVNLPRHLWPLYHVFRPIRLTLDRLVRRRRQAAWPFLGTPLSLVRPLLEFGQVGAMDRVVDLGCGDGRILVQAAQEVGCTAYGIEQDPQYANVARQRVQDAAVGDRVDIDVGDVARADLDGASVVFLFLPPDAVRRLVPDLLRRLPRGARILTHEQMPLHARLTPDATLPLFAGHSLTVAHRWAVP